MRSKPALYFTSKDLSPCACMDSQLILCYHQNPVITDPSIIHNGVTPIALAPRSARRPGPASSTTRLTVDRFLFINLHDFIYFFTLRSTSGRTCSPRPPGPGPRPALAPAARRLTASPRTTVPELTTSPFALICLQIPCISSSGY
jgi:hypothetical protein